MGGITNCMLILAILLSEGLSRCDLPQRRRHFVMRPAVRAQAVCRRHRLGKLSAGTSTAIMGCGGAYGSRVGDGRDSGIVQIDRVIFAANLPKRSTRIFGLCESARPRRHQLWSHVVLRPLRLRAPGGIDLAIVGLDDDGY